MTDSRLPFVLRLYRILGSARDFPGRDTLLTRLAPHVRRVDRTLRGTFGDGLHFEGNPARDGNVLGFLRMRYGRPSLAAVFDAVLRPGGICADVGANRGVYTLWAARRVGEGGSVHSFEPIPETHAALQRNIELNGFTCVRANRSAVGSECGSLTLYRVPNVSGLTSHYLATKEHPVEVPITTLDAYYEGQPTPHLVKIDVEAMEYEVFRGARELLARPEPPVVVWESTQEELGSTGRSFGELLSFVSGTLGFSTWALLPSGLKEIATETNLPDSLNVISVKPDRPAHAAVLEALRDVRFPTDQIV